MNIPNNLIRCPNCHSKLIGIWKVFNEDYTDILFIHGYCPSLRCKARKVTFDKNLKVLSVQKFSSLEKKKEVIAKILQRNFRRYNLKTKRKLRDKYLKLVKGDKNEVHKNKADKNKNRKDKI